MSERINKVALVLDPDYGDKLRVLANMAHVWVVDTPPNRAVAAEYWSEHPTSGPESGITIFKVSDVDSRFENCVNIIETIDLHHGPYSSDPPYSVLEVIGLPLTDEAKAALEDLGFETFETTVEGFRAKRRTT
ncbi:MAG TPA: hypothetical protein VLB46_01520 [Pyrinomonadaceae bacterium]|nr:hypothetical protein [Pyrinomonadaceae bacterium]